MAAREVGTDKRAVAATGVIWQSGGRGRLARRLGKLLRRFDLAIVIERTDMPPDSP